MDDPLKEAIGKVDVFRCWGELCPPAPGRLGVYNSPFREDKNPSFSLFRVGDTVLWKDQATGDKGGAWKFVERARPDWSKREVAQWFFQVSGVDPGSGPAPKPKAEKARERVNAQERVYHSRQSLVQSADRAKLGEWGARERQAWEAGRAENPETRLAALAKRRGWSVEWCWSLWELGLISFPVDRSGKRRIAFLVEALRDAVRGHLEGVGYHMRMFFIQSQTKGWLYEPKGVAAWPFVLGNPALACTWAVVEGQWDAVSLWGVIGGFDETASVDPSAIAVVGLRGAASVSVFLAEYEKMLSGRQPLVWLIADADEAGRNWFDPKWENRRQPKPVSFSERLVAAGAKNVILSRIRKPDADYKDFNDFLRRSQISRDQIWAWMRRLKVVS